MRPLGLRRGEPAAWDGRFEIIAAQDGLEVRALAGLAARLPRAQRRALAALPADVRPGLPAIVGPGDGVSCPLLGEAPAVAVELVAARLEAAAGLVEREPD